MTLPELLDTFRRRAVEAASIGATAPVAAVYEAVMGELAPLCSNGNGHGAPRSPETAADRLLKASEVAERLGCSVRQVYAKADTFPFTVKVGDMVRFSERGLEHFITRGAA